MLSSTTASGYSSRASTKPSRPTTPVREPLPVASSPAQPSRVDIATPATSSARGT